MSYLGTAGLSIVTRYGSVLTHYKPGRAENVSELETLISAEASGRRVILDLKDLRLVDQEVVSFLRSCEADNIKLENCPAYIRKWIAGGTAIAEKSSRQ